MKTDAAGPRLDNELAIFATQVLTQRHMLEMVFYTKSMRLIVDLQERQPGRYLTLGAIRRTLSSLKIDRAMAKHLLADLQQCRFLIRIPHKGYRVNKSITSLSELPYQPANSS